MKNKISVTLIIAGGIISLAIFFYGTTKAEVKSTDQSQGWWVLTEYHDRILTERSIARYSFESPNYVAVILDVRADSVFSSGTSASIVKANRLPGDTIFLIESSNVDCRFTYSKKKKCIEVHFMKNGKLQTFHYRRMRSDEFIKLTAGLFEPERFWPLHENYHKYWHEQFLAGSYISADGKSHLTISKDESVEGFGTYNISEIGDFFGNNEPPVKTDLVRFLDNRKTGQFKDYQWECKLDTLILTEQKGQDHNLNKKGITILKYIRQPQVK
jgi:hypothetical protein